ncbi:MAG: hypothetical protein ONB16_04250 [candidate division KSB1 bacterium]|nr:hypothetical protein [candidate division KSB1 bacterium]MDZ7317955.1 hypothetical protein [candidate division KSB1 bacterium]MDZ7342151.1 hypothetical protein [candidate division KSB1 bacterium]
MTTFDPVGWPIKPLRPAYDFNINDFLEMSSAFSNIFSFLIITISILQQPATSYSKHKAKMPTLVYRGTTRIL